MMEIFNELTILVCFNSCLLFTDVIEPNDRYFIGWFYITVVALNITVNWTVLVFRLGITLYRAIKSLYRKIINKRKLRAKKYINES